MNTHQVESVNAGTLRQGGVLRRLLVAICLMAAAERSDAQDLATLEQQAFDAAVDAVADSVVQIRTIGGLEQVDDQTLAQGPTTGLIVSDDGYIVSSAFNFAQEPTSILVRLPSGDQRPAEIVGRDSNRMLVLLKVESDEPLPVAPPAPLDEIRPGDWAVAIGRTYRADRVNRSVGVVSALDRMHGRVLQTDANVSAANYGGPLVDIRGRVLGVLVPMAPQSGVGETSAVAGAEYYDSGIGFAVPLTHIVSVLPRWIDQEDLKRGLLGVALESGNPHATPPTITTVWQNSPAATAGWKPKDRIVAVDGVPIESQTQLRFQVVPRYAGDALRVTIRRGEGGDAEDLETKITLADKLAAYRHAFLGVLPARAAASEQEDDEEETVAGVVVRAVWPDSPAAKAGVEPGDRLTQLGDESIDSLEKALTQLDAKNPGDELSLSVVRGDETLDLDAELAELPTDVLSLTDLPATAPDEDAGPAAAVPVLEELKLPEMPQVARFLEPPGDGPPPGMLIWLGDGGAEAADAMAADWQRACRRDRLVLLMPTPGDATGWSGDDMEYLAGLLQTALRRFAVDPRRVVIAGEGKGGQLAYAVAFRARKVIRGVAVVDSPLPRTLELPENNPSERLAVLSVQSPDAPLSLLIRQDVRKLAEAGYPTTQIVRRGDHGGDADDGTLDSSTRAKIARWIDALDRF